MANPIVRIRFASFRYHGPQSTVDNVVKHAFTLGYCMVGVVGVGLIVLGREPLTQIASATVTRIGKGSIRLVMDKSSTKEQLNKLASTQFRESLESLLGLPEHSMIITGVEEQTDDAIKDTFSLGSISKELVQALRWLLASAYSSVAGSIEEQEVHMQQIAAADLLRWATLPLIAFIALRQMVSRSAVESWLKWLQNMASKCTPAERVELDQFFMDTGCITVRDGERSGAESSSASQVRTSGSMQLVLDLNEAGRRLFHHQQDRGHSHPLPPPTHAQTIQSTLYHLSSQLGDPSVSEDLKTMLREQYNLWLEKLKRL